MTGIYRGLKRALSGADASDNFVLLVAGLAAGGVWTVALLWGLPA